MELGPSWDYTNLYKSSGRQEMCFLSTKTRKTKEQTGTDEITENYPGT